MRIEKDFHVVYQELEQRMRALAEADGDVFLPNPEPEGPVQYVFICMEPSLGRWARSAEDARARVRAGFRNFLYSIEDFSLHFCIRSYLCGPAEQYHITDVSKGAMLVARAGQARDERYDRWYPLLQEEIELVATPNAHIFAVGKSVSKLLNRQGFRRPFTQIIHYSSQAARARNLGIKGREDSFYAFRDSVCLDDVIAMAVKVLSESRVPPGIRDETLSRLAKGQLSASRRKLIFNYKVAFESIRS